MRVRGTIETGLIGYGLGGAAFHAPLIRAAERLHLAAIATSRPVEDAVRTDAEALIADPNIALVVIASPNQSHFPLARAALAAGKHVVVDKPFTVSLAEADALIALAARQQRMLSVFHNRRWDSDYLTVKRLLAEGRLGEPTLFEAHWDRFRPAIRPGWRELREDGAGMLSDLGPHLIDQALQLFGRPDRLSADIAVQRREAVVDDYFDLTLFHDRLRVRLCASTLIADPRPRFALHGAGGSFVKYGLDPQEAALKEGQDPLSADFGRDERDGMLTLADGKREPVPSERGCYLDYYRAVAAAILDRAPPPVDPADAREGLRLIDVARNSAREGCVIEV
jgi:scyllo-inositol 2-dehydrogenase (NADP+)